MGLPFMNPTGLPEKAVSGGSDAGWRGSTWAAAEAANPGMRGHSRLFWPTCRGSEGKGSQPSRPTPCDFNVSPCPNVHGGTRCSDAAARHSRHPPGREGIYGSSCEGILRSSSLLLQRAMALSLAPCSLADRPWSHPPSSRTRLRAAPALVTPSAVMAGLDPAIPMLRGAVLFRSGSPAQGR
jgi:hypothetical protein